MNGCSGRRRALAFGLGGAVSLFGNHAYANVPVPWGRFTAGVASFPIGPIWGIALVAVILVEGFVFHKMLGTSWKRSFSASSLLNLLSTVWGVLFSFSFAFGELLIGGLVVFIAFVVVLAKRGPPIWFVLVTSLSGILGVMVIVHDPFALPPKTTLGVLTDMAAPFVAAFGMTLLTEGFGAKRLSDGGKVWAVLILANLITWAPLAVGVVAVSGNPYHSRFLNVEVLRLADSGVSPEKIVERLRRVRASSLFLIGLSRDASPEEGYDCHVEETLSRSWDEIRARHPELADAIQKDSKRWGLEPPQSTPTSIPTR